MSDTRECETCLEPFTPQRDRSRRWCPPCMRRGVGGRCGRCETCGLVRTRGGAYRRAEPFCSFCPGPDKRTVIISYPGGEFEAHVPLTWEPEIKHTARAASRADARLARIIRPRRKPKRRCQGCGVRVRLDSRAKWCGPCRARVRAQGQVAWMARRAGDVLYTCFICKDEVRVKPGLKGCVTSADGYCGACARLVRDNGLCSPCMQPKVRTAALNAQPYCPRCETRQADARSLPVMVTDGSRSEVRYADPVMRVNGARLSSYLLPPVVLVSPQHYARRTKLTSATCTLVSGLAIKRGGPNLAEALLMRPDLRQRVHSISLSRTGCLDPEHPSGLSERGRAALRWLRQQGAR